MDSATQTPREFFVVQEAVGVKWVGIVPVGVLVEMQPAVGNRLRGGLYCQRRQRERRLGYRRDVGTSL